VEKLPQVVGHANDKATESVVVRQASAEPLGNIQKLFG